jgi:hypothetical protein
LRVQNLRAYLDSFGGHFESVLAYRPTGWTYKSDDKIYRPKSKLQMSTVSASQCAAFAAADNATFSLAPPILSPDKLVAIYGVPYSEHSSFPELERFVKGLNIKTIIPTVGNGNERYRNEMKVLFHRWATERNREQASEVASTLVCMEAKGGLLEEETSSQFDQAMIAAGLDDMRGDFDSEAWESVDGEEQEQAQEFDDE